MQLSALFLSAITAAVCVNAATIPSHIKADNQDNLLQARSYDSVDSDNEAHLERRSPGYGTPNFGMPQRWAMVQPGFGGGGFGFGGGFGSFGGGGSRFGSFRPVNGYY
ncbi:hypothetical protein BASA83_010166 [Batrachochytrium salamandrivorans]|nr:hypothetical protein BASA81_018538 [Batrachochytrium salamandrivorans]KAH9267138.1 hypothetical protein BASA83_010166 [Batrachochytrium salamandrivorans]